MTKMKWNVFRYNINKKEIEQFDIFCHVRFKENVENLLKEHNDKEKFAEELKKELRYYYWCKCEYEIILSSWPPSKDREEEVKVDIFDQVMLNFSIFIDYVWSFKKPSKK